MDSLSCNGSVGCGKDDLRLTFSGNLHLDIFVYITVSVTRKSNGLCPVANVGYDALYKDGRAEYGSVKDTSDCGVRALPHLLKVVLGHTSRVGCDGGAFNGYAQLKGSICGINCNLIVSLVSVLKAKIVILCLKIDIRGKKFILDHLPEDSCHLVSVHLNEGCGHLNLAHF